MSGRALSFRIEGELYAIAADRGVEALPEIRASALPGLPAHVAGVMRFRGRWIPLVDGGPPLGLPAGPRAQAVVLRRGRVRFALGVDRILGIREDGDPDQDIVTYLDPDTLFAAQLPAGEEQDDTMDDTQVSAAPISAVVLRLGRQELGIEISQVHEVIKWREPAPVPRAPEFVEGVIDVRGAVLPIVDLRKRLSLPAAPPDADTRIIVAGLEGERIGLVVDQVVEVARIPQETISPPPRYFRGLAAELIQGLARMGQHLVVLVYIDRILSSEEHLQLLDADLSTDEGVVPTPAPDEAAEDGIAAVAPADPPAEPPRAPRRRRTREEKE